MNLKLVCNHRSGCKASLLHLRTEGDEDVYMCTSNHEVRLKIVYTKRFRKTPFGSEASKCRVPEHCLVCKIPSNGIVTDNKTIKCSNCESEMTYDGYRWVVVGADVAV